MPPLSQPGITPQNGQKTRRVLFVITQSEYGGAQRFLYQLISRLDRNVYEPILAAGTGPGQDFLLNQLKDLGVIVWPLHWLKRDINLYSDWQAARELARLYKNLKPEVIFLNSSKAGWVGSLAARLVRSAIPAKVIYRVGGWTFNDPWPQWKKYFFQKLEKFSARWKDIIIVNSQSDLRQAKQLGIQPRQMLMQVPNGLDVYRLDLLSPAEARLRLFEKIAPQAGKIFQAEIVIGTIANFYPAKGLDQLIETAAHFQNHPSVVFVVIGDGPEREKLMAQIKELGLEKKIFLVGQLPDAYRYLPAFNVFVLSSLKEGFPWSLLEAMAAKLPVVATMVGAVPEVITDGQNGLLVEPGNPAQLARRLKALLSDKLLPRELGIAAHQTVLLQYDLEKMVNRIADIL